MLTLTQLVGFGSGSGGGIDVTPNAINFSDVSDAGVTAAGSTNVVTITGIDTTITLRLTLSTAVASGCAAHVYRNGSHAGTASSGSTLDVTITDNQTLQYAFTNVADFTQWSGTATVSNLSDGGAVLDTFNYYLEDTGSGGGSAVVTY